MAFNFRPGGFEDDDDFDDDDGFCLSGNADDFKTKQQTFNPISGSGDSGTSYPRGGFGQPAPRKQEPKTIYKRSSDLRDEQEARPLDDGDYQMAIVRGNIDRVKHYLTKGFPVDKELRSGWSGLMYASNNANSEMVELLLNNGANANFQKDMYTVLMAACGAGGYREEDVVAVVDLLLGKGANANAYDRYHTSPVMYAAREGHSAVLEKLVEAGANINKQDNRGWTALTWAVSKKNKPTIRCLMKLKADPWIKHSNGRTVIEMAESDCNYELLEILEGKRRENAVIDVPMTTSTSSTKLDSSSLKENYGTTYGDLELFLCGLELSHLVDVVRSQHIDFNTLLRMTDEDLVKMGISQLGIRKKILDGIHSVHKKEWEKTSLPQVLNRKNISCAEVLAVLANISKHTKYINTTVGFLEDQIASKPAILDELQNGIGPKQLHQHTVDTLHNITALETQITTLKGRLETVLKTGNFDPPDLVKKRDQKPKRSKVPLVVIATASVVLIAWNRTFLWNKLENFVTRTS